MLQRMTIMIVWTAMAKVESVQFPLQSGIQEHLHGERSCQKAAKDQL